MGTCRICKQQGRLEFGRILEFHTGEVRGVDVCSECYDKIECGQIVLRDGKIMRVKTFKWVDGCNRPEITWEEVDVPKKLQLNREALHEYLDILLDVMNDQEVDDPGFITVSVGTHTWTTEDVELHDNTYGATFAVRNDGDLELDECVADLETHINERLVQNDHYRITENGKVGKRL